MKLGLALSRCKKKTGRKFIKCFLREDGIGWLVRTQHVCTYIYIYVYIHEHISLYSCICKYTYAWIYINTHTHKGLCHTTDPVVGYSHVPVLIFFFASSFFFQARFLSTGSSLCRRRAYRAWSSLFTFSKVLMWTRKIFLVHILKSSLCGAFRNTLATH